MVGVQNGQRNCYYNRHFRTTQFPYRSQNIRTVNEMGEAYKSFMEMLLHKWYCDTVDNSPRVSPQEEEEEEKQEKSEVVVYGNFSSAPS